MKKLFGIFFFLVASMGAIAQESPAPESVSDTRASVNGETPKPAFKIRPFRIGLKIGAPNLLGLNIEYLTPLLKHRLSASFDYSRFNIGVEDSEGNSGDLKYSYIELGSNYYLRKQGKGPYLGLGYGMLRFDAEFQDSDGSNGQGEAKLNAFIFKLGAKWGKGFYFRPEIGYALFTGDSSVEISYVESDGSVSVEKAEISDALTSGPVINIGIGVAF